MNKCDTIKKLALCLALPLLLFATSCGLRIRPAMLAIPSDTYHRHFPKDTLLPGTAPFVFARATDFELPSTHAWLVPDNGHEIQPERALDDYLRRNNTRAFIVIRNDSILYERYFNGGAPDRALLTFSVTKSIVSVLVGMALQSGAIASLEQAASDYLPAFCDDERQNITLADLLHMTSGLNYEDSRTIVNAARVNHLFWHKHSDRLVQRTKIRHQPGEAWAYKAIDTQVLGMALESALGMSLSAYFQQELSPELGIADTAYWCLDHEKGRGNFYAGLAMSPLDLARFARLLANNGRLNGKQLLPEDWVSSIQAADTSGGRSSIHQKNWWLPAHHPDQNQQDFLALGLRGQYVYIHPSTNTIIIRTGTNYGRQVRWYYALPQLAWALNNSDYKAPVIQPVPKDLASRICGTYKDTRGRTTRITYKKGALFATGKIDERQKKKRLRLYPQADESFINMRQRLRTVVARNGESVKGLIVEIKGRGHYLERVD